MSLEIIPIFCNEKNMANYAYIIHEPSLSLTLVIDAAEANPLFTALDRLQLKPDYILTTHHHFDHVGGNLSLKERFGTKIIAPEKEFSLVPGADIAVSETQPLNLKGLEVKVIDAPGHTAGHVLYHLPEAQKLFTGDVLTAGHVLYHLPEAQKLFTGDVLFNLCIGGLFEGTPAQMFNSLQKVKRLPDNTEIFPGHEYTRACLPPQIKETPEFTTYLNKMRQRENGQLAPATLAEEKMFNPYLRAETLAEFINEP